MAAVDNPNLRIWSKVQATDPRFTKQFSRGGGFKGTATNATYLARRATETFGPMGLGWGVKILDESIMDGAGEEKIHRVKIELWYLLDGRRGSIEHFGLTTFIGKNKHGLFTDEEAAKKSLTDAMTKALSMLGFAADVHLGMFDDNKYVNAAQAHFIKLEAKEKEERKAARAAESESAPAAPAAPASEPAQEPAGEGVAGDEAASGPVAVQHDEAAAPGDGSGDDASSDKQVASGQPQAGDEYAHLTEEQRDLMGMVAEANSIAEITEIMNSPEVQEVLNASSKPDMQLIRQYAVSRMKAYGWPAAAAKEASGAGA
jgi:hypothetical protein